MKGRILQVNHAQYGTLFAAMIDGSGELVTTYDEEGDIIPFLTTNQILKQIMKFGFYVTYNVPSNLPNNIIDFLSTIDNLDYDKITKVSVRERNKEGYMTWRTKVIVMKSAENTDLLEFGCKITKTKYLDKLQANSIMNVTEEEGMSWDWLTYIANISDLLDENLDMPDEYKADAGLYSDEEEQEGFTPYIPPEEESDTPPAVPPIDLIPEGYTLYVDPNDEGGEDEP